MEPLVVRLSDSVTIIHGDCRDVLPTLGPVDAVVTDPPYGLRFMGKHWDYDVPYADLWRLLLAACKPGAHLLSFAGTRTQHRMAVNIEDAGFEIRDMIAWVYGSGFPKSLDVSKAIDKAAGAEREVVGRAKGAGAKDPDSFGNGHNSEYSITAPATDAAKQWDGWGSALKPAMEMISVCRKPLIGTIAENVLAHGTGAINVDGCRIATNGERLQ
ncbi:MAG: site-specific DNA-methyltransferase, partial [Planctomycetes bacterium]|nr:site-specific DNA-methyltransferase [Planctomycetota bacterium]